MHVLSSNMHMQFIELNQITPAYYHSPNIAETRDFNISAMLFPYIADILFALHLVYEVRFETFLFIPYLILILFVINKFISSF